MGLCWVLYKPARALDVSVNWEMRKAVILKRGSEIMADNTSKASDVTKGFHPDGYRIDKTASPLDFYTKWEITPEGKWTNPKAVCFDSMPQEGWYKEER